MFGIRERCWNCPSPPNPDILITFTIQRTSTLPVFIAQVLSDAVMPGIYSFLSLEIVQKRGVGRDLVPIPAPEGHWDEKKALGWSQLGAVPADRHTCDVFGGIFAVGTMGEVWARAAKPGSAVCGVQGVGLFWVRKRHFESVLQRGGPELQVVWSDP